MAPRMLGTLELNRVHAGDCRDMLRKLPDGCIQAIVTSPPYFNLRRYEAPDSVWGGDADCPHDWTEESYRVERHGDDGDGDSVTLGGSRQNQPETRIGDVRTAICRMCSAWRGQLGLESSVADYVSHLVEVFCECRRVLRDDGSLWIVIADSYARAGGRQRGTTSRFGHMEGIQRRTMGLSGGAKEKDLLGVPWELAFALRKDGWWLRNDNLWAKGTSGQREILSQVERVALACGVDPETVARIVAAMDPFSGNPMPESCRDRSARAHEYVFHLSKSSRYFYDWFAASERSVSTKSSGNGFMRPERISIGTGGSEYHPKPLRNRRTVWTINTGVFGGDHHAVFPRELVAMVLQAAVSEKGACAACGAPWRRIVERPRPTRVGAEVKPNANAKDGGLTAEHGIERTELSRKKLDEWYRDHPPEHAGWEATCRCGTEDTVPCIVADPFAGSGTVGEVAEEMGHHWTGFDVSAAYTDIAKKRTAQAGLFAWRPSSLSSAGSDEPSAIQDASALQTAAHEPPVDAPTPISPAPKPVVPGSAARRVRRISIEIVDAAGNPKRICACLECERAGGWRCLGCGAEYATSPDHDADGCPACGEKIAPMRAPSASGT